MIFCAHLHDALDETNRIRILFRCKTDCYTLLCDCHVKEENGALELSVCTTLIDDIDGVMPALKRNSALSQKRLINAGVEALQTHRLHEIAIPALAKSCEVSVGAFYARFRDKDAFFRALKAQALHSNGQLAAEALHADNLKNLDVSGVVAHFVQLLIDTFNSPYRGVLRESYMCSQGDTDHWAEMRESGRVICKHLVHSLKNKLPGLTPKEAAIRLRFAYQTIVGILINDLVNSFHVFKSSDKALALELQRMLCSYLALPPNSKNK